MKKFFNLLLLTALFLVGQIGFCAQYKVIVLPDNLLLPSVDYYVYTDSADMVSTDVINYINKTEAFYSPSVGYARKVINSDMRIKLITKRALADFKNTYNIDFEAFKQIGRKFSANYILLITCNMDSSNYMFRRTIWDLLNFPGATVIDSAYRLSTEVFLLDLNAAQIVWQSNYQKLISSRENRIIANTFSPVPEQLEKIKNYSSGFLAPQIALETQTHIDDTIVIATRGKLVRPEVLTWDKGKAELKKLGRKSTEYSYAAADLTLVEGQKAGRKIKKETKKNYNKAKTKLRQKIELMKEQRAERRELKLQQKEMERLMKENSEYEVPSIYKELPPVETTAPTDDKAPVQDVKNTVITTPNTQQIQEAIPPMPTKELNAIKKKPNTQQVKPTKQTPAKSNVKPVVNNVVPVSKPKEAIIPQTIEKIDDTNIDVMPYAPQKPRLRGETMINDI